MSTQTHTNIHNKSNIIHQIQTKTNHSSFYHQLQLYDQIIKQHHIPRSSQLAMEIYQNLLQKQLSSNNAHQQINDPQAFFSFAKNKNNSNKNTTEYFKQIKPKKLFSKQIQFRSDKLPLKNYKIQSQIHSVSQFKINNYTSSIKKQSQPIQNQIKNKKKQLTKFILSKYIKHFIQQFGNQETKLKDILNKKTSIYFHDQKLIKKAWKSIKLIFEKIKLNQLLIDKIQKNKNEDLIEECFLGWKQRAFMTQPERQYQIQLQNKTKNLSKIMLLIRLKYHKQVWKVQQNQRNKKIQNLQKLLAIQKFKKEFKMSKQYSKSIYLLKKQLQKSQLTVFFKLMKARSLLQENKQNLLVNKCLYIRGISFFKKLKQYHQFKEVYWRNKQKIVPLYMLLDGVKFSLMRKGFLAPWIHDFDQNIYHSCVYSTLTKHIKEKFFNGWKKLFKEQKRAFQKIKIRRGKQFIFKLTLNYKRALQFESFKRKTQMVQNLIFFPKKIQTLNQLMFNQTIKNKQKKLYWFLRFKGITQGFEIMRSYKLTKRYYYKKFAMYQEHSQQKLIQKYFYAFKYQVQRRNINKNLLTTHVRMENIKILHKCFRALKSYSFNQKIMKIKSKNFVKLSNQRFLQIFITRLRDFNNIQQLKKNLNDKSKQLKILILRNRIQQWYKLYAQKKIYRSIEKQIIEQKELMCKWRIFEGLKIGKDVLKEQKKKIKAIQSKNTIYKKRRVMNKWIQRLTIKLVLKNLIRIKQRFVLKEGFQNIKYLANLLLEMNLQQQSSMLQKQ